MELFPGIDGLTPKGEIEGTDCCPPDICAITEESLACNFINLLPNGPLWDEAKLKGLACKTWCESNCPDDVCGSLVAYAAYTGRRLHTVIQDILWPSIREASPYTAWDNMDDWLDRLGWVDCYNGFCRDPGLGELTPYEILGECGPQYCPPTFPDALARLYKRGVIVALWRMRHGFVKNLSAINFILSSLYSTLELDPNYNPNDPAAKLALVLRPSADFAHAVTKEACPRTEQTIADANKMVKLYMTPGNGVCVGAPSRVYPLTLAAHCIVRSLLPSCSVFVVNRKP